MSQQPIPPGHTQITASLSCTVNLGNYQNAKPMAAITRVVPDEEVDQAFKEAWETVEGEVYAKARSYGGNGK